MDRIRIEKVGGFAGFGSPGSKLRSTGEVTLSRLSLAERSAIEDLFSKPVERATWWNAERADAFRYRISRDTPNGTQTIEVPESHVPESVKASVTDTLD